MKHQTTVERKSDRELIASRVINGPQEIVFEAWTNPELFKKWWVPKSAPIKLESCAMDVRTGGGYRLKFSMGETSMEFFGKYLEVTPHSKMIWTNEEGGADAAVITTVTFVDRGDSTFVTVHDLYPSKEALDAAIADESTGAWPEQFDQLQQLISERSS
jgi:uncharacterized protein YndB with AHSA1/START domain